MEFDNFFFENEIRDGFLIPGMVKRSWAVQMEVLDVVATICKRHDLKWFADYGTLIGAIRHKGYIPWDDDLDICMFRDDYEKFHQYAKEELPEDLVMLCIEDNVEYDNFLIRITKGHFISTDSNFLMNNHGLPYCAGIDVFPLDFLYKDKEKEKDRVERVVKIQDMANEIYIDSLSKKQKKEIIAKMEAYSGKRVDKSIPIEAAHVRLIDELLKEAPREGAERVAMMHFYVNGGTQIRPVEWYEHSIEVKFENATICVPARYDEVLKLEYGNWGVANRRGGLHDYPFFLEQEGTLLKQNGSLPYRYTVPSEKEDIASIRREHYLNCNQHAKMLQTMGTVHIMIDNLMEKDAYKEAMELCQKCQEFALIVGNAVEEQFGEGTSLVSALEFYCEEIFHLFEFISAGEKEKVLERNQQIKELISSIEIAYHDDFRIDKKVLFAPVRHADWKVLEPLYQREMEKEDVQVYVMPLPFYERKDDGSIGDKHWDFEAFSSDLNLVDCHASNLNGVHFERIYFTNPYDEYQSGMTVEPGFYSGTLSAITDNLILVQNMHITNPLDEKTLENLKHYVVTPGVMRSDCLLVTTEDMKIAFEKLLSELSVSKDIVVDEQVGSKLFGHARKSDGKKNIVFWSSIANHYEKPNEIVAWIKQKIEIFEASKNVVNVYWVMPDPLKNQFLRDYPELKSSYDKLIDDFKDAGVGSIITEAEAEERLDEFDAFYGSAGFLLNQCVLRRIPTMISNMQI